MYRCVCGLETNSSNELKKHKDNCFYVKKLIENSPTCYCGEKLACIIHNGSFNYQKHCGKKECRSKYNHLLLVGRAKTKEHKEKIRQSQIKKEFVKTGCFVCEKCKKQFDKNSSLRSHLSHCGHDTKQTCDICGRIFSNSGSLKNHIMFVHEQTDHEKEIIFRRKKHGQKIQQAKYKRSNSLEKYFEENFLIKYKEIMYYKQYKLHDLKNDKNYYYDFYFEKLNLIIEVDGDYWHANPAIHNINNLPDFILKYKTVEKNKEKLAESNGIKLIRFWENDIKRNKNFIFEELDKCLRLVNLNQ